MKMKLLMASACALALHTAPVSAQDHAHIGHDMATMADEVVIADLNIESSAEGSGTARLPGNEGRMHGLHLDIADDWMIMAHGYVWGVYTDQSGPRGDDKAYAQSMAMLTVTSARTVECICTSSSLAAGSNHGRCLSGHDHSRNRTPRSNRPHT